MNKRKLVHIALLSFILAFALSGCHSSRTLSSSASISENAGWSTLNVPVKLDMEQPLRMNGNARLTMINGSCIHLSVRFLGIEVASMYMDTDSLYFVDKYHKYMFAEPLKTVLGSKYDNLTISDLQKIILGQKEIPEGAPTKIKLSHFDETPAGNTATDITVTARTSQGTIRGSLSWSPDDAKWNEAKRTVSFKVPDNYKRVTPDKVRSMLKAMNE